MSSTGRKKDPIWSFFVPIEPSASNKSIRAKCRKCKKELVGIVARMKNHLENCRAAASAILSNEQNTGTCSRPASRQSVLSSSSSLSLDISESATVPMSIYETEPEEDINTDHDALNSEESSHNFEQCFLSQNSGTESNLKRSHCQIAASTNAKISRLDKFVIRTTSTEKKTLDIQIGKFFYATNLAFRNVEHPEFVKLIELLRPGYKPPGREQVGNNLLDEVFQSVSSQMKKDLQGRSVCMAIDGWSNVHMEPVVCVSVTDVENSNVYLVESIDTEEMQHTGEFMLNLAICSIQNCQKYNCTVRSFVSDNASNMESMREMLARTNELGPVDIITYGCSAHILNLLAKDIQSQDAYSGIKKNTGDIIKYFRNHHYPAAKFKQAGGSKLNLPSDTRWNSLSDSLESYLKNWHVLSKVCSENRAAINKDISLKVFDMDLKLNTEEYLVKVKLIGIALDRVQSDDCTIGEAADIWLNLLEKFKGEDEEDLVKNRFSMAMTVPHYLAHLLDPRFDENKLNEEQIDQALLYVNSFHPSAMPDVIKYRARSSPFKEYMFSENSLDGLKPITWWLSLRRIIKSETLQLVKQLHSAVASSAGVERVFSSFGIVHSKLRNRLGTEKAAKLVTVFKELNRKTRGNVTNT